MFYKQDIDRVVASSEEQVREMFYKQDINRVVVLYKQDNHRVVVCSVNQSCQKGVKKAAYVRGRVPQEEQQEVGLQLRQQSRGA